MGVAWGMRAIRPWARTVATLIMARTALFATATPLTVVTAIIAALGTFGTTTLLGTLAGTWTRMRCTRLRYLQMRRPWLGGMAFAGCLRLFLTMLNMLWVRCSLCTAWLLFVWLIGCIRFREGCLQTTNDRRLHSRGRGLDELPHVLEFLKDGFAINAKLFGQFIYALFCHSVFSYSVTARICAVTLR